MTNWATSSLLLAVMLASPASAQTERHGLTPPPARTTTRTTSGMTNQDVLRMVQAGLGEAVVIATVRTAAARNFDLSPDGLISLKKGGVSDAIVAVMIDPNSRATPAPSITPARATGPPADARARVDSATVSPDIPREPGIYWDRGHDGAHDLVALEPTVFSQGKTGGMFTSAMTYGIKKIKLKAITRGSAAGLHIGEPQPTFYFYFESKGSGLANTGGFTGWLSGATSPNEFILARMNSTSKDRELIVGEMGAFGGSAGARPKDTVDIHLERMSGGVYRVKASEPLEPGEYCFFYAGGASALGVGSTGSGKLFDFGIYDSKDR